MYTIKILSLIFLSVFLIFHGFVGFMGFNLHWIGNLLLGISAVVSGVLILLSIHEFYHPSEEE
jgi:hypothetical protein